MSAWNINPQHQPQQLPFPTDQVIPSTWFNSPRQNPPECPLAAPGAASGVERNILGELLEYVQSMAGTSPIRTFMYNMLSRQEYNNKEFTDLLNTVFILTAALLESNRFQNGSQAAEFAVARMVEYQCVMMAMQYPILQDMEPQMAGAAQEIHEVGTQLGQLIKSYKEEMARQQSYTPPGGGGGGWGMQPNAVKTDRWGNASVNQQSATPPQWGGNTRRTTPPMSEGISTDIFKKDTPPRGGDVPQQPVRSDTMTSSSALASLYGVTPPSDTSGEPSRPMGHRGAPTPVRTEHPTGNTVHMQPKEPVAAEPAVKEEDDVRWVINSDKTVPVYMTPSPSPDGRQNLVYERGHCKPAYRITNNHIDTTVTERDSYMSAGYGLHELTFKNKDGGLFIKGEVTPKEVLYNREKLLKSEGEEIGKTLSYYQEEMSGGHINETTLLTLGAVREACEEKGAIVVLSYTEKNVVNTNTNIKEYLDAIKAEKDPSKLSGLVDDLVVAHPYWGNWLKERLTALVTTTFQEDYGQDITMGDFCEDFSLMDKLIDDELTEEVINAVRERVLSRIEVMIGTVGYLEGSDTEWGMCTMTHTHCIIDVPMTAEQLELSGDSPIGRLTKTTAPELYRIIEGGINESPDHYYWLVTKDGSVLELRPAPGGSNDWLIAKRDRIGH